MKTVMDLLEKGKSLILEKKYQEAIIFLSQFQAQEAHSHNETIQSYANLIFCHNRLNQPTIAAQVAKKALKNYPKNPSIIIRYAETLKLTSNYKDAISLLNELLARQPLHQMALLQKSLCLIELKSYPEAEHTLSILIEEHPNNFHANSNYARIPFNQKNWDVAIYRYQNITKQFPNNKQAKIMLSRALVRGDKHLKALGVINEMLVKNPTDTQIRNLKIETLLFLGKLDETNNLLISIKDKHAYQTTLNLALGQALNVGDFDRAIKIAQLLIGHYPESIGGYHKLSDAFFQRQDYVEAIRIAKKTLAIFTNDFNSNRVIARSYIRMDDFELAKLHVHQLTKLDPKSIAPYNLRMHIAAKNQNLAEAIEILSDANDMGLNVKSLKIILLRIYINLGNIVAAKAIHDELFNGRLKSKAAILTKYNIAYAELDFSCMKHLSDQLILLNPNNLDSYFPKFNSYLVARRYAECQELISDLISKFGLPDQLIKQRIRLNLHSSNFNKAMLDCETILEKYPNDYNTSITQVQCMTRVSGYEELAVEKLISLASDERSKDNLIFQSTASLVLRKTSSKQFETFITAFKQFNKNPQLLSRMLRSFELNGDYKFALEQTEKTISDNNESAFAKFKITFEYLRLKNLVHLQNAYSFKELEKKSTKDQSIFEANFKASLTNVISESTWINVLDFYKLHESYYKTIAGYFPNYEINTYSFPLCAYNVAKSIIDAILKKQPFMMLRLSDGEGMYLPYSEKYAAHQESDQLFIQQIWWKEAKLGGLNDPIISKVLEASEDADILGIPCLNRIYNLPIQTKSMNNAYQRGLLSVNKLVSTKATEKAWNPNKMITSCFIHHHLSDWGLYDYIFSYIDACSIVTCHTELEGFLGNEFKLEVRSIHLIPPEKGHAAEFGIDLGGVHYPDRYDQLCEEINVSYPGEVFLVAAGFIGKIYCKIIKERGGIALDVGSMVDYWLNKKTRAEVTTTFDRSRLGIWHQFLQSQNARAHSSNILEFNQHQNIKPSNASEPSQEKVLQNFAVIQYHFNEQDPYETSTNYLTALEKAIANRKSHYLIISNHIDEKAVTDLTLLINKAPKDSAVLCFSSSTLPHENNDNQKALSAKILWRRYYGYQTIFDTSILTFEMVNSLLTELRKHKSQFKTKQTSIFEFKFNKFFNEYTIYALTYPTIIFKENHTRTKKDFPQNFQGLIKRNQIVYHKLNPRFKYPSSKKNNRPHRLIIGTGTGRSGTTSFSKLLSFQDSTFISHEMNKNPYKLPSRTVDEFKVIQYNIQYLLNNKDTDVIGDIASPYLYYTDEIIKHYPNVKMVYLHRPVEDLVPSFMKFTRFSNNFQSHDGSVYRRLGWYPIANRFNSDITKEEALKRHCEESHELADKFQNKYPDNFRIFQTYDLNDPDKTTQLLKWLGFEDPKFKALKLNATN